jgi:predicted nuclease of predicted toxin-antitoxin system
VRFFLDQNVDARVAAFLAAQGHKAWTADQAGLSAEEDPNLTVYAHDQGAVLLTHDKEFSTRVRGRITGRHVWLNCIAPAARPVVERHLDDLEAILARHQDLFVELRVEQMVVTYPNETWDA